MALHEIQVFLKTPAALKRFSFFLSISGVDSLDARESCHGHGEDMATDADPTSHVFLLDRGQFPLHEGSGSLTLLWI